MNTSFAGNRVGGKTSLDITGSYPTGIMAALGDIYNDSQELTIAQLRFTAAQVDITAQQNAAYATTNLEIQQTGTVSANSLNTQVAATVYKNAAEWINYLNQHLSNNANITYTNAHAVYKICCDASHIAFLAHEAAEIIVERAANTIVVTSVGMSVPDVNPIDITTLTSISTMVGNVKQDAHNATGLAHFNTFQYILKLQSVLNSAKIKSTTLTNNLRLVAAFRKLSQSVIKNILDPLSTIANKELLVTQYIPSIPLSNAINVANIAIVCIEKFIIALFNGLQTTSDINNNVNSAGTLANSLDILARENDNIMYLDEAVSKNLIQTASTLKGYGSPIASQNIYPNTPYRVSMSSIQVAKSSKKIALEADISASNARAVSDALLSLKAIFLVTTTPEPMAALSAQASLNILNEMMASIKKVTQNSSSYEAVTITGRAFNTITGLLSQVTQGNIGSSESSKSLHELDQDVLDSQSVLSRIDQSLTDINTYVPEIDPSNPLTPIQYFLQRMQNVAWRVNAAKGKAEEISEKAKNNAFILSRTAHKLVTPQNIAIQTASANTAGAMNNNYASRLDRNSRNVPLDPPRPYSSYKAGIRAKTIVPVRPSLDYLVYKNSLHPIRLDSIRTINAMNVKVAKDVQRINDISAFSFRQQ